jgi:hypothetical protein
MFNLPTTEERLGKSPQRLVRYFVLIMALVYLGLGIWFWYTADRPSVSGIFSLGPTSRRILGTVLILYGLLRSGRAYQAYFRKTPTSNEHD